MTDGFNFLKIQQKAVLKRLLLNRLNRNTLATTVAAAF